MTAASEVTKARLLALPVVALLLALAVKLAAHDFSQHAPLLEEVIEEQPAAVPVAPPAPKITMNLRHIAFFVRWDKFDEKQKYDAARATYDELHGDACRFAAVATERSEDVNTKDKGGSLGVVDLGALDRRFAAVAAQLKPGEISEPLRSSYGWHLLLRDEGLNCPGQPAAPATATPH